MILSFFVRDLHLALTWPSLGPHVHFIRGRRQVCTVKYKDANSPGLDFQAP